MKKLFWLLLCFMASLVGCDNTNSNSDSATKVAPPHKNTPAAQSGLWLNKITHTNKGTIYTAILEASAGENSFGAPVKLIISCNNGQSELAINWGSHAPRGTKIPTDLRIGNEPVTSDNWQVIRETDRAYQYKPNATLALLVANNQLIARTVYFKGGIATAYFKLEGINNALKDIRKACHW